MDDKYDWNEEQEETALDEYLEMHEWIKINKL